MKSQIKLYQAKFITLRIRHGLEKSLLMIIPGKRIAGTFRFGHTAHTAIADSSKKIAVIRSGGPRPGVVMAERAEK